MVLFGADPPFSTFQIRLTRHAAAIADARRSVRDLLRAEQRELGETVELLVSELVTNAVRHGEGPDVRIALTITQAYVRAEVVDRGSPEGVGFRPGRYGLRLVDRLAARWGVEEGSSHVWFELERR